jgi:oligoribonuclease (3'-5' exoribonuclease)
MYNNRSGIILDAVRGLTLKELARRWAPGIIPGFSKQGEHKALADIQESIRELAFYRRQLFAAPYNGS